MQEAKRNAELIEPQGEEALVGKAAFYRVPRGLDEGVQAEVGAVGRERQIDPVAEEVGAESESQRNGHDRTGQGNNRERGVHFAKAGLLREEDKIAPRQHRQEGEHHREAQIHHQ